MKKALLLAVVLALIVPSFAFAAPDSSVSQKKIDSIYKKTGTAHYNGCTYQKVRNVYRKGSNKNAKIWICVSRGG